MSGMCLLKADIRCRRTDKLMGEQDIRQQGNGGTASFREGRMAAQSADIDFHIGIHGDDDTSGVLI